GWHSEPPKHLISERQRQKVRPESTVCPPSHREHTRQVTHPFAVVGEEDHDRLVAAARRRRGLDSRPLIGGHEPVCSTGSRLALADWAFWSSTYAATTCSASPICRTRPLSSHIALSQKSATWLSEWDTNTIVPARSSSWRMVFMLFSRNSASPTASTSSSRRMSGFRCIDTENANRENMPDE